MDVASYIDGSRAVTDDIKFDLICQWVPEKSYKFPGKKYNDCKRKDGSYMRYCNRDWLTEFTFLSYSRTQDGLYCLSCVLFPTGNESLRANLLINTPYQNWKNVRSDMMKHSTLQYHKTSDAIRLAFIQTRQGSQARIDHSLTSEIQRQVASNRTFLKSIISCLEVCGRQGISLRGHRDDATCLDSLCQGNFKALIQLRIEAGDVALSNHLRTCSSRSTYISKTTQNELLSCIGETIQAKIVKDIKSQSDFANFFGIEADEVTDVSNWEQLGIIIRYLKDSYIEQRDTLDLLRERVLSTATKISPEDTGSRICGNE